MAPDLLINELEYSEDIYELEFSLDAKIEILFNFFYLLHLSFFQSLRSAIITWRLEYSSTFTCKHWYLYLHSQNSSRWKRSSYKNGSDAMFFKLHSKNFEQTSHFFHEADGTGPFFRNFHDFFTTLPCRSSCHFETPKVSGNNISWRR